MLTVNNNIDFPPGTQERFIRYTWVCLKRVFVSKFKYTPRDKEWNEWMCVDLSVYENMPRQNVGRGWYCSYYALKDNE